MLQSIVGLVFFGTPFRGSKSLSQTEMLAAAYKEHHPDFVQPEVLNILEPGNEFLQELVKRFSKMRAKSPRLDVACFFELKPSNVGAIVGGQNRIVRCFDTMMIKTKLTT